MSAVLKDIPLMQLIAQACSVPTDKQDIYREHIHGRLKTEPQMRDDIRQACQLFLDEPGLSWESIRERVWPNSL